MPKFKVEVSRLLRDVQWQVIEVEAADAAEAGALILDRAQACEEGFWDDATIDPIESSEPDIERVTPVTDEVL